MLKKKKFWMLMTGMMLLKTQPDGYHVQEHQPDGGGDEEEHFLDVKIDNSLHNEEDRCVEEEEVLDVDDLYDATEDQFLASLEQFITAEGGSSVDEQEENWGTDDQFHESIEQLLIAEGDSSNDGKDMYVDDADVSEKTGSEIMTTRTVLMETCGDDNNTNDIEKENVSTEEDTKSPNIYIYIDLLIYFIKPPLRL